MKKEYVYTHQFYVKPSKIKQFLALVRKFGYDSNSCPEQWIKEFPAVCFRPGDKRISGNSSLESKPYKVISNWEELISFLTGDYFQPIEIPLEGGSYTAVIGEKDVTVGCQNISFDKVAEIYFAVQKAKEYSKNNQS